MCTDTDLYLEKLDAVATTLEQKIQSLRHAKLFRSLTSFERDELRRLSLESSRVARELHWSTVVGPPCPVEVKIQGHHLQMAANRDQLAKTWKEQAEQAVNKLNNKV